MQMITMVKNTKISIQESITFIQYQKITEIKSIKNKNLLMSAKKKFRIENYCIN